MEYQHYGYWSSHIPQYIPDLLSTKIIICCFFLCYSCCIFIEILMEIINLFPYCKSYLRMIKTRGCPKTKLKSWFHISIRNEHSLATPNISQPLTIDECWICIQINQPWAKQKLFLSIWKSCRSWLKAKKYSVSLWN